MYIYIWQRCAPFFGYSAEEIPLFLLLSLLLVLLLVYPLSLYRAFILMQLQLCADWQSRM